MSDSAFNGIEFKGENKEWGKLASEYLMEWEKAYPTPVDVFDYMTSEGYKLNLITGEYFK